MTLIFPESDYKIKVASFRKKKLPTCSNIMVRTVNAT